MDEWSEENRLKLRQLFIKHHHIFALDDLELGKTDMVKHVIRINDEKPFRERYRRIPPHQYDEVKKHLKEMLEIGAIRKSQSPTLGASVTVVVLCRAGVHNNLKTDCFDNNHLFRCRHSFRYS